MRCSVTCTSAKTESQAERPPIFQPVSSTFWTALCRAASTSRSSLGWASRRR
jgi:hypothetical protein